MLTFQNLYEEAQAQSQDDGTDSLVIIKRAINQGMRKFMAILNREWTVTERTFNIVASQQFYQMPEDAIRVKTVSVTLGSVVYPLTEVASYEQWQELTMRSNSASVPTYFFVKGSDQFGIWPTPSGSITSGGTLTFEPATRDMAQADYVTGSVALTNGSAAVIGSGTTFTAKMVGRTLILTDGTSDGIGYKIASYTDATHITLENYYGGSTTASSTYNIGEVPNIPEEFHESLIDYAMYRYYARRRDWGASKEMKTAFDIALNECRTDYGSKTTSQYTRPIRIGANYTYPRRDLTVT